MSSSHVASQNVAPGCTGSNGSCTPMHGTLPFTGADVGVPMALAAFAVVVGLGLRRFAGRA